MLDNKINLKYIIMSYLMKFIDYLYNLELYM